MSFLSSFQHFPQKTSQSASEILSILNAYNISIHLKNIVFTDKGDSLELSLISDYFFNNPEMMIHVQFNIFPFKFHFLDMFDIKWYKSLIKLLPSKWQFMVSWEYFFTFKGHVMFKMGQTCTYYLILTSPTCIYLLWQR